MSETDPATGAVSPAPRVLLEAKLSQIPDAGSDVVLDITPSRALPPLIPPGEYDAICTKAEQGHRFDRDTVYLLFEILDGPHDGEMLFLACPLPVKAGKSQRPRLSPATKLYETWAISIGRPPTPKDRLALRAFTRKLYRVSVRTVSRDARGRTKPEALRYSVVDRVLGLGNVS